MNIKTKAIIRRFDESAKFSVESLDLQAEDITEWVEFVSDPVRFTSEIFDGLWARSNSNPKTGQIRVIRVIKGKDGVSRAIGRQEKRIYAYPWI